MKKILCFLFLIIASNNTLNMSEEIKNKKNYTVIVIIEPKLGCEAELKQLLLDAAQLGLLENDCLLYKVHEEINNPLKFILYEQWKNKEAHQQYHKKLDSLGLTEKFGTLLATRQAIFAEEI